MNKIKTLIAIVFAIAIITNIAYSQENKANDTAKKSTQRIKKENVIGNTFICPVSGKKKQITLKTLKYEYNGKTYYFCCNNCVEEFKKDPSKYIKEEKEGSIIGNKLICPVMKSEFIPTDKSPKTEYKGKTYYFCCPDCVEKFNKEPEKYLKSMKKGKMCCKECDEQKGKHKHPKK